MMGIFLLLGGVPNSPSFLVLGTSCFLSFSIVSLQEPYLFSNDFETFSKTLRQYQIGIDQHVHGRTEFFI